jgi:hypothetical protein
MYRNWRTLGLILIALLTAGCTATAVPEPAEVREGRLIGRGTVIDDGSGPRLCFFVLDSYAPQCGAGVELVGWRWPDRGVERVRNTTWGDFAVVGTDDGRRFHVEKTVEPATLPPTKEEPDFASACPEPAGGWRAPDPERATRDTQDEAFELAQRLPGYGDAWIDGREDPFQNPTKIVVNVTFTHDLSAAERAIRRVWGGALCVSKAERSHAELAKIHRELEGVPRSFLNSFGHGHVDLRVVHDDGTLAAELDRKYGPGLVRVDSALKPYVE